MAGFAVVCRLLRGMFHEMFVRVLLGVGVRDGIPLVWWGCHAFFLVQVRLRSNDASMFSECM